MLFFLTSMTEFVGMGVCLWLALFLFSRGFPNPIALRSTLALAALAGAFMCAYINLHTPAPVWVAWWAALLTIALVGWYSVTDALLPPSAQHANRWVSRGIYAACLLKAAALIAFRYGEASPVDSVLQIVPLGINLVGLADILLLITTIFATLRNFQMGAQYGVGLQRRSVYIASGLGAASVVYGMLAIVLPGLPRMGQTGLIVAAVLQISYAVATHQALVERRTTHQDFWVAALITGAVAALYAGGLWQQAISPVRVALFTALVIVTHATYDMAHEGLDRLWHRREQAWRQQLRRWAQEAPSAETLPFQLQQALVSLCEAVRATGGFIAVQRAEGFVVLASWQSLPLQQLLAPEAVLCADVQKPLPPALAAQVAWLAPASAGQGQLAVIGLGARTKGQQYTDQDLDWLMTMSDWVGQMVLIDARQNERREQVLQLAAEAETPAAPVREPGAPLPSPGVDADFVRSVEESLRRLHDYPTLGESALSRELDLHAASPLERGKLVRAQLLQAIEALRPNTPTPAHIPSREWHSYLILHEAYVNDVPNREIMGKLFISEGTFNRQRRKALQAVAQVLLTRPRLLEQSNP